MESQENVNHEDTSSGAFASGADTPGMTVVPPTAPVPSTIRRQEHAVRRLGSLHYDVIIANRAFMTAAEIRSFVDALRNDLEVPGANAPPLIASQHIASLRRRADEMESQENNTTATSSGADIPRKTIREIEDEVDRRLRRSWLQDASQSDPPSTLDRRRSSRRYISSIENRRNDRWPALPFISDEAQQYYRSPWRADRHLGYGFDSRQSPFAEIFFSAELRPRETPVWTRIVEELGKGGQGTVSLWQMTRQNGQPLRIVSKRTKESEFFLDYCSEGNMILRLNAAGCKNVITVLDWFHNPREDRYKFKIILEYAEHGDLFDIMIWYHVRNLARALVYCRHGNSDGFPQDQWEEMVCADLKDENILLSEPDDTDHKLYPSVKLADFGHAYTIPSDVVRRFKNYSSLGTEGWQAPEIVRGSDVRRNFPTRDALDDTDPSTGLSGEDDPGTHSDIWALGTLITRFMSLVNRHLTKDYARALLRRRFRRGYYSQVLSGLVERCLDGNHESRITPLELFKITSRYAVIAQEKAYQAAQSAQHAGRSSYPERVLYRKEEQRRYRTDPQFAEEYRQSNISTWHELNSSFTQETPLDEHNFPRELLTPPSDLDLDELFEAARYPRSPSPSQLNNHHLWTGFQLPGSRHHPLYSQWRREEDDRAREETERAEREAQRDNQGANVSADQGHSSSREANASERGSLAPPTRPLLSSERTSFNNEPDYLTSARHAEAAETAREGEGVIGVESRQGEIFTTVQSRQPPTSSDDASSSAPEASGFSSSSRENTHQSRPAPDGETLLVQGLQAIETVTVINSQQLLSQSGEPNSGLPSTASPFIADLLNGAQPDQEAPADNDPLIVQAEASHASTSVQSRQTPPGDHIGTPAPPETAASTTSGSSSDSESDRPATDIYASPARQPAAVDNVTAIQSHHPMLRDDQQAGHLSEASGSTNSSPLSDVPPGEIIHPFPNDDPMTKDPSHSQTTGSGASSRGAPSRPEATASYSSINTPYSGPSQPDNEDEDPRFRVRAATRRKYAAQANDPGQVQKRRDRIQRSLKKAGTQKLADQRSQKNQREVRRKNKREREEEEEEQRKQEEERRGRVERQVQERAARADKRLKRN